MYLRRVLRSLCSARSFHILRPGVCFLEAQNGLPFNQSSAAVAPKVFGCTQSGLSCLRYLHEIKHQHGNASAEEALDPFALVADELSIIANRLRKIVAAEVPELASAAEYFFKLGVEGKRFRPTILLLMASAIDMPAPAISCSSTDGVSSTMPNSLPNDAFHRSSTDLRARQQCIAEITEMIHVASLLHDDVLDDAETRRGIQSLNFIMGNKGIITAPILFAMEEFPQLRELAQRGFKSPGDVDTTLNYLQRSRGIQRTKELAQEHAKRAAVAIQALPPSEHQRVQISRRALVELTQRVITRTK